MNVGGLDLSIARHQRNFQRERCRGDYAVRQVRNILPRNPRRQIGDPEIERRQPEAESGIRQRFAERLQGDFRQATFSKMDATWIGSPACTLARIASRAPVDNLRLPCRNQRAA
jgi:hypothetical protein